jgi:hypothetical protein
MHFGPNEQIVREFLSAGVEFVVVGGLAVSWYCADRQPDDMDLLVNPTEENSVRISQALGSLQMHGFNDRSFTKPGLQVPLKQMHYAELLTPRKDGPAYMEVANNSVDAKLFNIPVRVASPGTLIRMKEQALVSAEEQKDKHLKDIQRLRPHAV